VLGALDDKIAANTRFLTTARELVDAELDSALAASAETRTVDDLAAFHNRRRVPLSANQRKERAGDVPYYGAAGPIDTVDVALFDEEIVLVGEDGSVMTERGAPVVQYVWGPSWVNNHAHVLTGSSVSTPFLRVLMERGNVAHLVTGAVQPKLSMGNLKRLELSLPADSTQLQATVDAHAAIERAKKSESRLLAATRNALLPLLMSGKVRVQDAESVVGEVL
jgi:type I restriction enzyme S subunit